MAFIVPKMRKARADEEDTIKNIMQHRKNAAISEYKSFLLMRRLEYIQ